MYHIIACIAIYKFVNFLCENLLFVGDLNEIEKIDKRLYLKLLSNDIKQVAFIEEAMHSRRQVLVAE